MSDYQVAFYVGLFGSIHCIGMCGPLAFSLPVSTQGWVWLTFDKLVYQFGRIISYTLLGLLIGLIGKQIWLLGLQKGLSIASGILIILAATARLLKWSVFYRNKSDRFIAVINRALSYALRHRWGHLFVGMLNGFLPCGFVYLALVGALNTNSVLNAGQYMAFFGLGTLPLMFLASVSSGLITISVRNKMNKVVPYFMLCLGAWFILRASSLNIPYLSPVIDGAGQSVCK